MPMIGLTPARRGLLVELVGAEHVAVVGHRDGGHAQLGGAFGERAQPRRTVEHGVLGVHVKVDEGVLGTCRHRRGALLQGCRAGMQHRPRPVAWRRSWGKDASLREPSRPWWQGTPTVRRSGRRPAVAAHEPPTGRLTEPSPTGVRRPPAAPVAAPYGRLRDRHPRAPPPQPAPPAARCAPMTCAPWCGLVGDIDRNVSDDERIDQLRLLEDLKNAAAAAQARIAVDFDDSQRAEQEAAGVPESLRGQVSAPRSRSPDGSLRTAVAGISVSRRHSCARCRIPCARWSSGWSRSGGRP